MSTFVTILTDLLLYPPHLQCPAGFDRPGLYERSNLLYKPHKIPKRICFSSALAVVFAQFIVENEDVFGAELTVDAPTTSEW